MKDGYCDAGFNHNPDEEGFIRIAPFDSLSGLAITVRSMEEIRYSANTHIPQLTMAELWTGSTLRPRKRNEEEIDLVGEILALGDIKTGAGCGRPMYLHS